MCLFIETVCIEHGEICHVEYHNWRMNQTRAAFFGASDRNSGESSWDISSWLHPEEFQLRTRCRILYGNQVENIEFFPYMPRKVTCLRLIEADGLDYRYKYADRTALNRLYAQRGNADEVLIVRHGLLTDTSIANIALWNGTEWHTPAIPLLGGTCRCRLLDEGVILAKDIPADRLREYSHIRLFNAMLHWGEIELDCARAFQNR